MKRTRYLLAIIAAFATAAQADERGKWIAIDGKAQPGDPVLVNVQSSTNDRTVLNVHVSGVWARDVDYGAGKYTALTYPPTFMMGKGFPREMDERGWWDFPQEAKQPLVPGDRYLRSMETGVRQADISERAALSNPKTLTQLLRAGVDASGARPGVPHLRGLISVDGQSQPDKDIMVQFNRVSRRTVKLPQPLLPAGYAGIDAGERSYAGPQIVDTTFYRTNRTLYKGAEKMVGAVSRSGPFTVCPISMPLLEFRLQNWVSFYTDFTVTIHHRRGASDVDSDVSWDSWMFKQPFLNGHAVIEAFRLHGIHVLGSRRARYLIVTPRTYRDELDAFAQWKRAKGLAVDFAFVGNGIFANVPADRDEIDDYIEDYYHTHQRRAVYVLIVGDVDVVPSGRTTRINAGPDFANGDSDHVYEVIGNDQFPSVYVGRLSVNDEDELTTQLDKILSYERAPAPGDWPLKAVLAANSENDDGTRGVSASWPSKYAGAVNEIAGYSSYTNPPAFEVLHAGASSASMTRATNQDVIDAIDAGVGHVLYRGHGSDNAWVAGWDGSSTNGNSFDKTNDVPDVTNSAFPIMYSIACVNNRVVTDDCMGERWMSQPHGAVAHWSATVNSYTTENHERAKGVFRALYESHISRLAPALAEAERLSFNTIGSTNAWDNNTFCYLLLGDPELTIRHQRVMPRFTLTPDTLRLVKGPLSGLIAQADVSTVKPAMALDPAIFGLDPAVSVKVAAQQAGETVKSAPVVDDSAMEVALAQALEAGKQQVLNHPEQFGLTPQDLPSLDANAGLTIRRDADGQFELSLQLQRSADLQEWEDAGEAITWVLEPSADQEFFRIASDN